MRSTWPARWAQFRSSDAAEDLQARCGGCNSCCWRRRERGHSVATSQKAVSAKGLRHQRDDSRRWGKGGAQVLDYAIAYRNGNRGFARTIALLDTDTDWSQAHRARARRERITVVESQPCLEAVLLDVVGRAGERTTEEHKRLFRQVFGHPAHEPAIYDKYFCAEVLEEAKARVDTMRALLRALTGKEH